MVVIAVTIAVIAVIRGVWYEPLAELVDARHVGAVDPALVEEDDEDDIVAEAGEAVHQGHLDDKSEEVVDERVEGLVDHGLPGQVRDGLELVVDEQLRRHHHEPERIDEAHEGADHPGVPGLVLVVREREGGVAGHEALLSMAAIDFGGVEEVEEDTSSKRRALETFQYSMARPTEEDMSTTQDVSLSKR